LALLLIDFSIQELGIRHFFISQLKLKDSISIDSIEAMYQIASASHINVEEILIGLNVHMVMDNNYNVKLKGFDSIWDQQQGDKIDFHSYLRPIELFLKIQT
jgi:hypothetical protein